MPIQRKKLALREGGRGITASGLQIGGAGGNLFLQQSDKFIG